jgi:hypothetical protein
LAKARGIRGDKREGREEETGGRRCNYGGRGGGEEEEGRKKQWEREWDGIYTKSPLLLLSWGCFHGRHSLLKGAFPPPSFIPFTLFSLIFPCLLPSSFFALFL